MSEHYSLGVFDPVGSGSDSDTPSGSSLLSALDLPPALHPIQDAYWKAYREFAVLKAAYEAVVRDYLGRDPGEDDRRV